MQDLQSSNSSSQCCSISTQTVDVVVDWSVTFCTSMFADGNTVFAAVFTIIVALLAAGSNGIHCQLDVASTTMPLQLHSVHLVNEASWCIYVSSFSPCWRVAEADDINIDVINPTAPSTTSRV